jgi:Cellobiose phosphorylase
MKPVFLDDNGTFSLKNPENVSALYFPLASERGLKSAVTPNLGGDSKLDQESFLLEPVSVENLHNNRSTRNFWCVTQDGCWSATGVSAEQEALRFTDRQDESEVTAGFLWQRAERRSKSYGLSSAVTSFIPVNENAEIMAVKITNTGAEEKRLRAVAAIPIYGRSADNLRDHRDVTAMLHRIRVTENDVVVTPTMSFDEKGHRENRRSYYVLGSTGDGERPESFFPTAEAFLGEGGSFTRPRALCEKRAGVGAGTEIAGKEAMGGLVFPEIRLKAGESAEYIVLMGIADSADEIDSVRENFKTSAQIRRALRETQEYWQKKVNVRCHTGDADFDKLLRWVSFQPLLRRIFGCSFLPHHDYGRGGRGWRDLWQDCLSLLLMDPSEVRGMIEANFGGVRIDGTNATIIGEGLGNFVADRNGIARVWMDHAMWPLMTVRLYIDQTGDLEILDEETAYFKDPQGMRGTAIDELWRPEQGSRQLDADGRVYTGSVLEHLLIEHLTAFYEVGEHNILRLRGADWNDALDMAAQRGESVAFSCAYAGNLRDLAVLLRQLSEKTGAETRAFCEELGLLLGGGRALWESVEEKTALLNRYTEACAHSVSGRKTELSLLSLAGELEAMADWMMEHLRRQEWLDEGWFNSYYDNNGRRVEGSFPNGVRMMLTGQVFAVMSGTATEEQTERITDSADRYLYDGAHGGYRLNTDFHELKSDMGRMFGFAYGEKENGAVFSHMAVMYANALYRRGFVREGYRALQSLADTALDFETSRIYPGIPEYFSLDGRGRYAYLTGAASWYMLTMMTEAFGVRGELGNLVIAPKLVKEQFDEVGKAGIDFCFAGKQLSVTFVCGAGRDCGEYRVGSACLISAGAEGVRQLAVENGRVLIKRGELLELPASGNGMIVELI